MRTAGQKGTIGHVEEAINLPRTENGLTPDIIINPHCFVASTPVLLQNGMSRPLVEMNYNGGNKVWSLDVEKKEFVASTSMEYESKGFTRDVVEVTFSDGRKIRCTPDHRFPILREGSSVIEKVPIS